MDVLLDEQELILYTIEDIQRIFKIGRTKAYQLMCSSSFPMFKLNRTMYVSKSELEKWIAKNKGKTYKY